MCHLCKEYNEFSENYKMWINASCYLKSATILFYVSCKRAIMLTENKCPSNLRLRFWPSTHSCCSVVKEHAVSSLVLPWRRIATFIQATRWATNMHITLPYNISVHWGISHRITHWALSLEADGLQQNHLMTAHRKNVARSDNGDATVKDVAHLTVQQDNTILLDQVWNCYCITQDPFATATRTNIKERKQTFT